MHAELVHRALLGSIVLGNALADENYLLVEEMQPARCPLGLPRVSTEEDVAQLRANRRAVGLHPALFHRARLDLSTIFHLQLSLNPVPYLGRKAVFGALLVQFSAQRRGSDQ